MGDTFSIVVVVVIILLFIILWLIIPRADGCRQPDKCCSIPDIDGKWSISGRTIYYTAPDDNDLVEEKVGPLSVTIKQDGRFFRYITGDRLDKLGVFEPIYLCGQLAGWKGHLVDTQEDNDHLIFNFTEYDGNRVEKFDITYIEPGFEPGNPQQTPRVEYATAVRRSGKRSGHRSGHSQKECE